MSEDLQKRERALTEKGREYTLKNKIKERRGYIRSSETIVGHLGHLMSTSDDPQLVK